MEFLIMLSDEKSAHVPTDILDVWSVGEDGTILWQKTGKEIAEELIKLISRCDRLDVVIGISYSDDCGQVYKRIIVPFQILWAEIGMRHSVTFRYRREESWVIAKN
jgi:hypothetical protein